MKQICLSLSALLLCAGAGVAQQIPTWTQTINACPITVALPAGAAAPSATLPPCVSRDTKPYTVTMVGRSPFLHGHIRTNVKTLLVSVILTFADNNITFDPTTASGRLKDMNMNAISVKQATNNSPILVPTTWNMNGVNVVAGVAAGTLQYTDAFQRANFWIYEGGTPHQTVLSPVTQDTESFIVPVASGTSSANCQNNANYGPCARVLLSAWDAVAQNFMTTGTTNNGKNAPVPITPDTFVIFIFDSVQFDISPQPIAGYHSSFADPNNGFIRTYANADFDTSGELAMTAPDVEVISHEVGEWMNNPIVNSPIAGAGEGGVAGNPAPAWGPYGQVTGCQANVEVGDPTSQPTPNPPIGGGALNPVAFTSLLNNFTYHLQELTYFSWFMGAPSVAAGGGFSNNGTFTKAAGPICAL